MVCLLDVGRLGCLCVKFVPLFFWPEYLVLLAEVTAVTVPLSDYWGSETAMDVVGTSISSSDSNGSAGGKYRGEESGGWSSSPSAVFVCSCAVLTGCRVDGSQLMAFGMTARMAVV